MSQQMHSHDHAHLDGTTHSHLHFHGSEEHALDHGHEHGPNYDFHAQVTIGGWNPDAAASPIAHALARDPHTVDDLRAALLQLAAGGSDPDILYLKDAGEQALWNALTPLVAQGVLTQHEQFMQVGYLRWSREHPDETE